MNITSSMEKEFQTSSPQSTMKNKMFASMNGLNSSSSFMYHSSSSPNKNSPLNTSMNTNNNNLNNKSVNKSNIEILTQHDLLIKQMDRHRLELFQRIHDRVNRAKQMGALCNEQVKQIHLKINEMEDKLHEAHEEHFHKHILLPYIDETVEEHEEQFLDEDYEEEN
ncbi:hypothetical protein ABK040_005598 [Willaertia magna]